MFPLTVYFDGACPVCAAEMDALRRRDRHERLRFVDVAAPGFTAPAGTTLEGLGAALHVRMAGGGYLRGVEAIRVVYGAVGLGALLVPTAWPVLRALVDRAYLGFARRRRALPAPVSRLIVAVLSLKGRREGRVAAVRPQCRDGACALDADADRRAHAPVDAPVPPPSTRRSS